VLLGAVFDPFVDAAEDLLVPGGSLGEIHPVECSHFADAVTASCESP
jgi:hypothetical protein